MRILDTDVCIEILRGNPQVIDRRRGVVDRTATTWITAAELHFGAAKSRSPLANQRRVNEFLGTLEVLGLDLGAAQIFGRLKAELETAGRRLPDADLLIAATALARGAILVTGNVEHHARVADLQIEDWIRGADPMMVNEPGVVYDADYRARPGSPARRDFLELRGSVAVGPGSTVEDVRRARTLRGSEGP